MLHNVTDVTPATLLDTVAARFPQGYRLITLTCVDCGDAREILYHFDRNYELSHVRLRVTKGTVVPSISNIYRCAVIVENELKDLFGLTFDGLALDYQGRFMLAEDAPLAPMVRTAPAQAAARNGEMTM
jgi:NADH:ubiquinone oxidoreductase subunit C